MKKSILFLPAPTRSHLIPALYLANLLSDEYEIHCVVTNEILQEIVIKQGYSAILAGNFRVAARMEDRYILESTGKNSKWSMVKAVLNNELYFHRQQELSEIIDLIKPSAIFIDIFESTDLIALYSKYRRIPILFVNPMLSTYRVKGYPAVMEGFWPDKKDEKMPLAPPIPILNYFLNPFSFLMKILWDRQLDKLMKLTGLAEKHPIAKNRTHTILFDGFSECVMAPLELEFSIDIRKPNQEYFGLSITEDGQETELDGMFDGCLDLLKERKGKGERIIYCAFGTYYKGNYQPFLTFLNTLLSAIDKMNKIQVVISVNGLVIDTIQNQRQIPSFVHFFTRVPQLEVLKISDLHITHGGMGSIKESILYAVPMLVYPLEPKWDNNGNGLKVEYHGLGITGSMHWERGSEMQAKIERVLFDNSYLENIRHFRDKTISSNEREIVKGRLLRLVNKSQNPDYKDHIHTIPHRKNEHPI